MTRGLFEIDDRPPLPAIPPRAPSAPRSNHPGITDAEAKRLNRALDVFKLWLARASAAELDAVDLDMLTRRHVPMTRDDIALMIKVRRRNVR